MYTINTQLDYFKYSFNFKRLLVHIKWFKLEKAADLRLQGVCFNRSELENFKRFADRNKLNFPGSCFVGQAGEEVLNLPAADPVSERALPYYLILSKNPKPRLKNLIPQVQEIVLTGDNYESTIDYNLDFDVIGKIEIYKNIK
ncbi:hypothetical protein ACFFLS_12445 [Flavobacterium procerum]|uniref:IPExxxVDY family protein n=1 Tax=Flavobacterium procerum TaxID=1455569 RepID=A0ABV6BQZ7_9FLAO